MVEKLDGKEVFDLNDVYSSTMKILNAIPLEVTEEKKTSDIIDIEFR